MYCKNCGQELADTDVYCTNCGKSVSEETLPAVIEEKVQEETSVSAKASFGWAVLGFFIPVVGLILFILWKTEHPSVSRKAGIGALVGVVTEIVVAFVTVILSILATIIPLAIIYGDAGLAAISTL